jgi:argininosuccinate lyase
MSLIRGHFEKDADKLAREYSESISFDWRLYSYDIAGSQAHARMLSRTGIISNAEGELIIKGLSQIKEEITQCRSTFKPELEDIHMNIEARLGEIIGTAAGKLHTARSRNDQVALDMRLYTKDAIEKTLAALRELRAALLDVAEAHREVVLPGYTHLQPAQPVLLSHHLLAYFEMLGRDAARFKDGLSRTDVMPLGSGALAGVTYAIDRESVARELGFAAVSRNSLDAVSDRDFVIEYEAAAALTMMHLSRLSEEVVLWSSAEFGYIILDDAYATGSSIMPQKKNADVAELARGKTGRVYGRLLAMLTTMKGLPLSYNRDLQEDKEGLFDAVDTLLKTLSVYPGLLRTMKVDREKMAQALERGYILATDLADYLAKKGLPFREAHAAVGRLTAFALKEHKGLLELSLDEYHRFSPLFDADVLQLNVAAALSARNVPGGTAPDQVNRALTEARQVLGE